MRILLAIPLMLAGSAIADASHCRPIKQQVLVQQQIAAAQILVPAYGGSYGGAPQQQIDGDLLRRLVEVLEKLEANQNAPAGGHTAQSIMKTNCAACHTEGKLRGNDFLLFDKDGSPIELSIRDKSAVRRAITSADPAQRMPPERGLSPQLQQVLIQELKK